MKRSIISCIAASIAAIAVAGLTLLCGSQLFSSNVKALAGVPTPVRVCYLHGLSGESEVGLFCNENTSNNMLYDCPDYPTYELSCGTSFCTIVVEE